MTDNLCLSFAIIFFVTLEPKYLCLTQGGGADELPCDYTFNWKLNN